ncbi:hypothetical protein BA894_19670 [Vibrio natriegens]|uniref:flavin monoamine oxidase family protein n=1 Tax=Vibrio natriegens TaxID=691 RepID=UPI000803F296|nr:flavin monoamine oxidase family protein [Vibrio natriegens]ANQ28633.1 hypothetical protein BA894_19670 [Vibrio natriegens]
MDNMGKSRREFIQKVMAIGGAGAALATINALSIPSAFASDLPPKMKANGNGKKVLILGGGLAGMTSAYELAQKGYDVQIIEARSFAGGRCQTARKGMVIEELGGTKQICDFDKGQYLNLGPMRIPAHHRSTLYYTQKFKIPLETYINYNEDAWVYNDKQKSLPPQRMREVLADMHGYVNEMMAKSLSSDSLDKTISDKDKELLLAYLIREGHLDQADLSYKGYGGRGYKLDPGALLQAGDPTTPNDLESLLESELWNVASSVSSHTQPKTVFQPVGGMDMIAKGFEEHTKQYISYNTEVQKIRQKDGKVIVDVMNLDTKKPRTLTGDFCICTIPLSVLKQIDSDFSPRFKEAMEAVAYTPTCKLGIQTATRFWETKDLIFGGHSVLTAGSPKTGNITYPSHDMFQEKGVLLSAYNFNSDAAQFSALSPQERFELSVRVGQLVHGDDYKNNAEKAVSISWHLQKYNLGGWASWTDEARDQHYPILCEPEGNIYLAGEHMSYMNGWMAGAIESAWDQIAKLDQAVLKAA